MFGALAMPENSALAHTERAGSGLVFTSSSRISRCDREGSCGQHAAISDEMVYSSGAMPW